MKDEKSRYLVDIEGKVFSIDRTKEDLPTVYKVLGKNVAGETLVSSLALSKPWPRHKLFNLIEGGLEEDHVLLVGREISDEVADLARREKQLEIMNKLGCELKRVEDRLKAAENLLKELTHSVSWEYKYDDWVCSGCRVESGKEHKEKCVVGKAEKFLAE